MTSSQLDTIEVTRLNDDPIIYVDRRCEFTRIIVSLTRNNNLWLTPLGWRPEEKSIALDCDNTANGLAIRLPKKYAKEISTQDLVSISCQELGFAGQMLWGGSEPEIALAENDEDSKPPYSPSTIATKASSLKSVTPSVSKKVMIGGIAALALFAVIGTVLIGGKNDTQTTASVDNSALKADEAKTRLAEKRKAAEAVAAEIESKIKEADDLAAKKIEDEKAAIIAAENAKKEQAEKERAEKEAEEKAKIKKAEADKLAAEAAEKKKAEKEQAEKEAEEKAKLKKAEADKLAAEEAKKKETARENKTTNRPRRNNSNLNAATLSSADIKDIQNDLALMGYYTGPIDGVLNENTLSSIGVFRSIFETTGSTRIDRTLLNEVKKQRETYVKQTREANVATTNTATIAPTPRVEQTPAPSQATPPPSVASALVRPATTIPPETKASPSPDIAGITPPKLLKAKPLNYPNRPRNRKEFTQDVTVIISFGVNTDGKPFDIEVVSNDYEGIHTEDFNKAALKYARTQVFESASRGGTPISVDDVTRTILFKK